MAAKQKKKRSDLKNARAKQDLRRVRIIGMAFLIFMLAIDGYALYIVNQHWQMDGKVRIPVDTAGVLAAMTVIAVLNLFWSK